MEGGRRKIHGSWRERKGSHATTGVVLMNDFFDSEYAAFACPWIIVTNDLHCLTRYRLLLLLLLLLLVIRHRP